MAREKKWLEKKKRAKENLTISFYMAPISMKNNPVFAIRKWSTDTKSNSSGWKHLLLTRNVVHHVEF